MIIQAIKKQIKLSKAGKPYASVLVQFDEYKDGKGNRQWISGFGNKFTWAWKVGDDVAPAVEQKGNYYNFTFRDEKENALDVYRLPATIGFVLELMEAGDLAKKSGEGAPKPERTVDTADDEINPEDIPF